MQVYLVSWRTTGIGVSDSDIINEIREAVSCCKEPGWLAPAKVGDVVISSRDRSIGEARVEIDGPVPKRYLWGSLDIEFV